MLKADRSERIGIVAGGGTLPFAVARAVAARGKTPVLLAIEGYCDPSLLGGYEHHWVKIGRMGRILQILRAERLHEIVCVGSLVRPALSEILLDWQTIRILPALITAFRGGDDHLLTGVARLFEKHGLSFVGIADVAPELKVFYNGNNTSIGPHLGQMSDTERKSYTINAGDYLWVTDATGAIIYGPTQQNASSSKTCTLAGGCV